jgi:hypothetical protein
LSGVALGRHDESVLAGDAMLWGKRSLHTAADPETQDRLGEMATRESNDSLVRLRSKNNRGYAVQTIGTLSDHTDQSRTC